MEREAMKDAFVKGMNAEHYTKVPPQVNKQVLKDILKTFEQHFPILYSAIAKLKVVRDLFIGPELKKSKNGDEKVYSQYAIKLQSIESEIFIDGIARELTERGIFCYTVHDCVGFREQDREEVKECMVRHLKTKIGFEPVIR